MICAAFLKVESNKSLSPRAALCSGYVPPCCCLMQQKLGKIDIVLKKRLCVALSPRHIFGLCETTHDNNKKTAKKYIDAKRQKKTHLVCKDLIRRVCQSAFWKREGNVLKQTQSGYKILVRT